MLARRLAVIFLLLGVLHSSDRGFAQDVKSSFDKSVDFTKYKKYAWGSNYLLTQQPKDVQERINMAIIDSINRDLQASGFAEDDQNPDFMIHYDSGGLPDADMSAQRPMHALDMVGYSWGNLQGISSDAWVYSFAKLQVTVTDAATKNTLWQSNASQKIDPKKFGNKLKENVDKFIQKTMKSFPPKK